MEAVARCLSEVHSKREYTFGLQVPTLALAVYFPKLVSLYYLLSASPGCLGLLLGLQHLDVRSQRIFPTTTEGSCKKVRVGMLGQFSQSEEERENFRTENGQF